MNEQERRWRDEFPITRRGVYLNSCSLAPLHERGRRALETYAAQWSEQGGAAWYGPWIQGIDALRGDIALRARQWAEAERDLAEALKIAQQIGYPTLTWQAAHLLARALAAQSKKEEAFVGARLGVETIDAVAARIPEAALRETFLAWPRVQAVRDDLDRLRRA